MVAATFSTGEQLLWQAEVDPFTRRVVWASDDAEEIITLARRRDIRQIGSNMKFDGRCMKLIDPMFDVEEWLCRCHETIGMHHALNNRESHALKDAAAKHGGIPSTDETDLKEAVTMARLEASKLGWAIASPATCPQVRKAPKKGWGVMDMWVPRQMALHYWRTSEAFNWLESLPKVPRFKPNSSQADRIASCFGKPDPTTCDFHTPGWHNLTKAQKQRLISLDGFKWHPPEFLDHSVHPWHTLCATYCKTDTLRSVTLYPVFEKALHESGLWSQYEEHRINTVMSYRIEERGVSLNTALARRTRTDFAADAQYTKAVAGYALSPIFPFNPNAHQRIKHVLFDDFGLPVTRRTKSGAPSTDKDVLASIISDLADISPTFSPGRCDDLYPPTYIADDSTLWRKKMQKWHTALTKDEEEGRAKQCYMFCASLLQHSKSNKGIGQIDNFVLEALNHDGDFATVYPSINPYGTKTTRQSSKYHTISKGGKSKEGVAHLFKIKRTLRMLFGPRPGREWWSVDYTQIQLVIFAFLSGDSRLIAAVLRGDDFHAAMARIIFGHATDPSDPRYDDFDPKHNPVHAEQRDLAKNVNFAFLFGAQEDKINRVSGMPGLYDLLCNRLPAVIGFLDKKEWEVRRLGYVSTAGGYRLYVPSDKAYSGSVYCIQGTEGEIVKRATYGVQDYLDRRGISDQFYITLPVHDELNFDSESGYGERHIGPVCQIMEDAAMSYGFPCKVTPKLCRISWAKGDVWEDQEEVDASLAC